MDKLKQAYVNSNKRMKEEAIESQNKTCFNTQLAFEKKNIKFDPEMKKSDKPWRKRNSDKQYDLYVRRNKADWSGDAFGIKRSFRHLIHRTLDTSMKSIAS